MKRAWGARRGTLALAGRGLCLVADAADDEPAVTCSSLFLQVKAVDLVSASSASEI